MGLRACFLWWGGTDIPPHFKSLEGIGLKRIYTKYEAKIGGVCGMSGRGPSHGVILVIVDNVLIRPPLDGMEDTETIRQAIEHMLPAGKQIKDLQRRQ